MNNLNIMGVGFAIGLLGLTGCRGETQRNAEAAASPNNATTSEAPKTEGPWSVGDTISSGMDGVPDIRVLEVRKNGDGAVCGTGKSATLAYKAMLADGTVIDAGKRPFSFTVGSGQAIKGWDVVVAKMRVGDSFTIALPQQLAYGPSKGDLKFDMELLSFR